MHTMHTIWFLQYAVIFTIPNFYIIYIIIYNNIYNIKIMILLFFLKLEISFGMHGMYGMYGMHAPCVLY